MVRLNLNKSIKSSSDFMYIPGSPIVKRSLEISAAGMFHLLFFGPPNIEIFRSIHALHTISPDRDNLLDSPHVFWSRPCSCGNLGIKNRVCNCSEYNLKHYWKILNGISLRAIDMRVPVKPVNSEFLISLKRESSVQIRKRVTKAIQNQEDRFSEEKYNRNSKIPIKSIRKYCQLDSELKELFSEAVKKLSLTWKSRYIVLKIARTIADLNGSENIERDHLLEAVHYRRYGDHDLFWREI